MQASDNTSLPPQILIKIRSAQVIFYENRLKNNSKAGQKLEVVLLFI